MLGGYTYQASAVSEIYAAINTPTTHYDASYTWHSSNPDSWTRANNPTPSTAKSIFDPCPYGYRVPTSNADSKGSSDFFGFPTPPSWSTNIINGMQFLGSWWPTSGRRLYNSAALDVVGENGIYCSPSPCSSLFPYNSYSLYLYSGGVTPANGSYRSPSLSVRCVQEERKKFLAHAIVC